MTNSRKSVELHSSQLTAHSSQPRLVFINYANEQYKYQQKFALWAAKKYGGFTEVKAYGPDSLDDKFRTTHKELLSIKRGNGLWIWKPYIILNALDDCKDGDYVFYCDSGACFFSSVMPLISSMGDSDVWVSNISLIEEQWTKPQVFDELGITDEGIKCSGQVQSGFVLVRKSEKSVAFVREWLSLCVRPELIKPLEPGEYKGECLEHREDQSMLSVLSKMRGIKAHKNPSIMPTYNYEPVIIPKIKLFIKKLIGWKIPPKTPKGPPPPWVYAKRVQQVYDDTYSPCIYLHRIRRAKSVISVAYQIMRGMGFKAAVKRFL